MLPELVDAVDGAGECGRLAGPGVRLILNLLGAGQPLAAAIREGIGGDLAGDVGPIHIHTDTECARLAELLGAEAFAVGRHIVFASGRFDVESSYGVRLLRHELAHVVAENGREDTVNCWFTMANEGRQYHGLTPEPGLRRPVLGPLGTPELPQVRVGTDPNVTHEDLTALAVQEIGGFGSRGTLHLRDWVRRIDEFKRNAWPSVLRPFPQLQPYLERLVHSWRGERVDLIGMTSPDLYLARFSSRGIVGALLHEAAAHFNRGYQDHALKLLGVSLHTIQDFYSHRVDIRDARYHRTMELRDYVNGNAAVDRFFMEDDPKIAPDRWARARIRSAEQLKAFKSLVNPADLAAF